MKNIPRSLMIISLLVTIALLLTACQTADTETAPPPTTAPSPNAQGTATEPSVPETATSIPIPVPEEPPAASLRINDQTQTSGIGSYCWPGVAGEITVCADKLGVPTVQDPLPADLFLAATFELPLPDPPNTLVLTVKQVSDEDEMESSADGFRLWEPFGGEQYLLPLEASPQIELTLDEGLYVFSVFAQWQGRGDVTYGFLVDTTLSQGTEIPSVGTSVTAVVTLLDEVTFYSGPGESYDPVATVFGGLIWPVIGASEDEAWWQLSCTDDLGNVIPQCWVSADREVTAPTGPLGDEITALPTNVENVLILALFGVNMRSSPEVEAEIIDVLPLGGLAAVTGMSEDGTWWRVRCLDGTIGNCWISADPAFSLPTTFTNKSLSGLVYYPVDEQLQLWIVQPDLLPALKSENFRGKVSPDGKTALGCCLSRETLERLTLIDLETGDEAVLVDSTGFVVQDPRWWPASPEKVFFLSKTTDALGRPSGPGLGYLTVVNTDGSSYEILDSDNNTHSTASLSPDGQTIAYNRGDDSSFEASIFIPWVYRIGTGPEAFDYTSYGLEDFPDLSFGAATWSPDGNKLAWMVAGELADDGLWRLGLAVFDLEGQTVEIITQYVPTDAFPQNITSFPGPVWSPAGEWISWEGFPAATLPGFWAIKADGTEQTYIENATTPIWSPDGQLLAFNITGTILVMESGVWEIQHGGLPTGNIVIDWVQLEE